jgi:hypothetical protein
VPPRAERDAATCQLVLFILRAALRHAAAAATGVYDDCGARQSGYPAGMTPEVEQLLAERDKLLVERDELRALVAKQFADLAGLRHDLDALERQFAQQLQDLTHQHYQWAQQLGLTLPARN